MAITTDYDAPRRSTLDEEAETESLDALATAAKTAAQSPDVDLEESDTAEGIDLPGADLSGRAVSSGVSQFWLTFGRAVDSHAVCT